MLIFFHSSLLWTSQGTFKSSRRKRTNLSSENFPQDPLENYFGKQRSKGGRNETATAKQSLDNVSEAQIKKNHFQEEAIDETQGRKTNQLCSYGSILVF